MAKHQLPKPLTERLKKIMSDFGARLKAARSKKYTSAEQFANALAIHPHRYRTYERGQSQPDFELLTRICVILEVTPNDLLPEAAATGRKGAPHPRKAGGLQTEAA